MSLLLVVLIISILLSAGIVAVILKLSHKKGWYDHINERKIHTGSVPRLGGIGFASSFLIILAALAIYYRSKGVNIYYYLPCAIAMVIAFISGLYDDFRPLLPRNKFMLQIAAALLIIIAGFDFDRLIYIGGGIFTNLGILSIPIGRYTFSPLTGIVTILWIVGITNAINLIDGIDGLAGGISAIIAFFLALIFFSFAGASKAVFLCVCLFGTIIGFLIFNWPFPVAKIFMGDGGSYFLGLTLALLPLMKETDNPSSLPVFYAAALFAIPILDTIAAVWRRLRDKRKISEPDKSHLHHKLLELNLSVKSILAILYSLQIVIGILTYISIRLEGVKSLLVLALVYIIVTALFIIIHFLTYAKKRKITPPND